MPRVTFSAENKAEVSGDFPRLKLENGEKARIVCIEKDGPVYAYVHTLRAPKIVDRKPEMQVMQRKDGTSFETNKMDFIGRPLCLGDLGILEERGVDPKNCPVCEMASQGDMVTPPQRRFAMHVVKYGTKTGTFDLLNPFAVSVVVWSFTDTIFNKLTDFTSEWGPLQQHDLLLGPCTNKDFQKFDIAIAAKAAWLDDEDRKNTTILTFKENNTKDLESFCGRKVDRRFLDEDLEKIRSRWRAANGESAPAPVMDYTTEGEKQSLTAGLAALVDDDPAPVLKSSPAKSAPKVADEEVIPSSVKTATKDDGPAPSWEDLLNDL